MNKVLISLGWATLFTLVTLGVYTAADAVGLNPGFPPHGLLLYLEGSFIGMFFGRLHA